MKLVPRLEDIIDSIDIFGGVANLIIDYSGFIHEKFVLNIYLFCSQIEGVSSNGFEEIDIYTVLLVVYEL